jgi:hypothetical protein
MTIARRMKMRNKDLERVVDLSVRRQRTNTGTDTLTNPTAQLFPRVGTPSIGSPAIVSHHPPEKKNLSEEKSD